MRRRARAMKGGASWQPLYRTGNWPLPRIRLAVEWDRVKRRPGKVLNENHRQIAFSSPILKKSA
jgi:hypothetical protein